MNLFNHVSDSFDGIPQSQYYTVQQFNDTYEQLLPSVSIFHANVRSFNANIDHVELLLESLCKFPHILVLSETWLSPENSDLSGLSGFKSFHTVRETTRGGGISIFVNNTFPCTKVDEFSFVDETIECCTVRVEINNACVIYIVGIYRPHSDTIFNFSSRLNNILSDPLFHRQKVYLLGDFNANLFLNDDSICNFMSTLQSLHFLPSITKPTRFPSINNNCSASLLDQIWTNHLSEYSSGILYSDFSDHCTIFIHLPLLTTSENKIKIQFHSHKPSYIDNFLQKLSLINWEEILVGDVHNQFLSYEKTVNDLYTKCFPVKTKFISTKRICKPWLSSGLMKSIKTKSYYFKLYKRGVISQSTNNAYRNLLNSSIRVAKTNYYRNSFKTSQNDMKKTWSTIKHLIGNSNKQNFIHKLIKDGHDITEETRIAETFNEFFTSVGAELASNIPTTSVSPLSNIYSNQQSSFFLKPTSPSEICNLILNLKKSSKKLYKMPVSLLVEARFVLCHPLTTLINNCFVDGEFPDGLKVAEVVPIFKSGDPNLASNFRPISLLSMYSKLVEKCMYTRLNSFISKHDILSPLQYGFQRERVPLMPSVSLSRKCTMHFRKKSRSRHFYRFPEGF